MLGLGAYAQIERRLLRHGETLHAPYLIDIEFAGAVRRLERRRRIDRDQAAEAIASLSELRIERYPHLPLLERMWQLRANLTPSDAAYVVLAEALDAPLITADERIARAPGHRARVEVYR